MLGSPCSEQVGYPIEILGHRAVRFNEPAYTMALPGIEDASMPRKARRKSRDTYEFLSMWLTGYDFRVEIGVNTNLRSNPLWADLDDKLFTASSWLEIRGKCFDPEDREGEKFVVTLVANPCPAGFNEAVRDVQLRNEHGAPQYRLYRGVHVPVFERPLGVTPMWRDRKADPWQAHIHVPERYVSDCLLALTSKTARYMSIHGHIVGKDSWINGFSIQSGDPTE